MRTSEVGVRRRSGAPSHQCRSVGPRRRRSAEARASWNRSVAGVWGEWSYNGLEAWRGMVTDWFGPLETERVAVGLDDLQTIVAQDVAVAHAIVTYKGLPAEGRELRAMHNRLTWALKQEN